MSDAYQMYFSDEALLASVPNTPEEFTKAVQQRVLGYKLNPHLKELPAILEDGLRMIEHHADPRVIMLMLNGLNPYRFVTRDMNGTLIIITKPTSAVLQDTSLVLHHLPDLPRHLRSIHVGHGETTLHTASSAPTAVMPRVRAYDPDVAADKNFVRIAAAIKALTGTPFDHQELMRGLPKSLLFVRMADNTWKLQPNHPGTNR